MAIHSRLLAGLFVLLLVGFISPARAESILPLEEVRAGMRGYGMTVFRGTTPERFNVEVIGVLHQFLPRQDLILIRMDHPLLERSGTVGGMSGSPIYVEGRLIGALAYGWTFSMDPIAGVTPIETMLEELDRPLRAIPPLFGPGLPTNARSSPGTQSVPNGSSLLGMRPAYWGQFRNSEGPVPAATPLLLGGFSPGTRRVLGELLGDFGLIPVEASAGGGRGDSQTAGPSPFSPGGAIGVQLVRGDLSATGIGTVTSVRGNRVLAFGHPMFGYGQQHYPVTTARIVTIVSSRRRSFKLGEPEAEAGALIQDRQPCIIADTSRRGPMTRLAVRIHDRTTGRRDRFDMEVVRERFLLPAFTATSVSNALERFASDRTNLMVRVRGQIQVGNRRTLIVEDQYFTERGTADSGMVLGLRPLRALSQIVSNPFEPANVEAVELDVSFDFQRDEAEIIGAYVSAENPRAGSRVPVHVVLRPFGAPEEVRLVSVELPPTTAGEEVQLHVTGGSTAQPPLPVPYNLNDLISNLERFFSSTSVVVTLQRRSPGVSLRGHIAQDLPPSALDSLRPLALDAHEQPLSTIAQEEMRIGRVVTGSARIRLRIEP